MSISVGGVIGDVTTYKNVLSRIREIIASEPGTPEYKELELLVILVEDYEKKEYEIPKSDPISIIHFVMEQHDLRQSDLVGIFGDKTYVSKVLNRKRPLTLEMIRKFSKKFHISSELLIEEYELV
jgi:HTH-type transcriptional regulator/antitoxin HigA